MQNPYCSSFPASMRLSCLCKTKWGRSRCSPPAQPHSAFYCGPIAASICLCGCLLLCFGLTVHALDQRTQVRVLLVRDAPHGVKHVALLLRLLTGLVEPLVDEFRHNIVHSRSPFSLLVRNLCCICCEPCVELRGNYLIAVPEFYGFCCCLLPCVVGKPIYLYII